MDLEDKTLIDNNQGPKKRFELHVGDQVAFIDYMLNRNGVIFLTHTEVPDALEGQGIGSTMVSQALEIVRERELKLAPLCPFVAAYLKEHPKKAEGLLAPGYKIG